MAQQIVPGTYRAHPVNAVLGKAKTGTPQVAVLFSLPDLEGATITWFGYLSDAARDRTFESLRYCGWTSDDLADGEYEINGAPYLGPLIDQQAEVELEIRDEPYEGKSRIKVAFVNSPGRGGVALQGAMSAIDAKTFAASLKGYAIAARQKPGAPQSTARGAAADNALTNDPIPF